MKTCASPEYTPPHRAHPAHGFILFVLIAASFLSNVNATTVAPDKLVIQATENLVYELRANGNAIRTKPKLAYELANRDIIPLIDFPTVARHVLGRYWRRATPDQQQRFTHEFRIFIINLYVSAMVTYSDEIVSTADSFEYPPNRWQPGDTTATVLMGFKLKGAAPVEVGYDMHWKEDAWKIHDVHALGLSFVAIYRSNFSSEIKQHGLDGLIQRLAAKNKTGVYSAFAAHNASQPSK